MITKRFKTQPIVLYFDAQPPLFRYGLAVSAVAAAAIGTLTIPVVGQRAAFLLFFFAIIQTAFWLGRNPGLLAMALSCIAVNALVLLPAWVAAPYDTLILNVGYCVLAAVFIATTHLHRSLNAALWQSRKDLNHAQAIGQDIDGDCRIILFVVLHNGAALSEQLKMKIKQQIRQNASPRHVPAEILQVTDIPRTKNGKIAELAVRNIIHGRPVKNQHALANPEALEQYLRMTELGRLSPTQNGLRLYF
jgi:hypothetical protein